MKNILVTGGAGYIGSHAVKALCDGGYAVTVLDNLSKGHRDAVDGRAEFVKEDLADFGFLKSFFGERNFDAVMHFAGSTEVGVSMRNPNEFILNNVMNGANLLETLRLNYCDPESKRSGVKFIFSSTAAVYGNPVNIPISEDDSLEPTNIYGVTKLMFEDLLKKYDEFWGMKYVALRYFNAAGADNSGAIGEDHNPETHLIPNVLKAALSESRENAGGSKVPEIEGGKGMEHSAEQHSRVLKVFGTDYDTSDGTCVRDYIHVTDLVDAHLKALDYLFSGEKSEVFNLGNGSGFSVREIIEAARRITGLTIPYDEAPRRAGDPAVLVADAARAAKILKWKPRYATVESIIDSAWNWHKSNPDGYAE